MEMEKTVNIDNIEIVDCKLEHAMAVLWLEMDKMGSIEGLSKMTAKELKQTWTGLETVYWIIGEASKLIQSEIERAYHG